MSTPWVDRRSPVTDEDRIRMVQMGNYLAELHDASGATWFEIAREALHAEGTVKSIAYGYKKTRRSTLARIVDAMVKLNPDLGPADLILERLCDLVGGSLAPESHFPERIERKLRRRARNRDRGLWVP